MAAIVVTRPATPTAASAAKQHPKMQIRTERNLKITLPYAPVEMETSGLSPTFTSADRPGRSPLLLRANDMQPVISFEFFLGHKNSQQTIEPALKTLRGIADSDDRAILSYGPSEGGLWRITSFGYTVTQRAAGSNDITRATVAATFTRAVDVDLHNGPASGGAKGKGGDQNTKSKKTAVKHYVVKKGDTLQGIAHKFYKDTSKWRKIADANNIKHPKLLKVGRKLVIP